MSRAMTICPKCTALACLDGDILPPACADHGGGPLPILLVKLRDLAKRHTRALPLAVYQTPDAMIRALGRYYEALDDGPNADLCRDATYAAIVSGHVSGAEHLAAREACTNVINLFLTRETR